MSIKKKQKMRMVRFIFFLATVFFISYFIAGGGKLFEAHTIDNIKRTFTSDDTGKIARQMGISNSASKDSSSTDSSNPAVNHQENNTSDLTDIADTNPSALDRASRVIFLKHAVEKRIHRNNYVPLSQIPEALQQAVIAAEDNRFYSHIGFDIQGIMRASLVNLQYGEIKEGASTITQQLVKNLFLSQEQSFGRKGEELLLAMDMELNYSKDEILELYLNTIYFGSGYYGIKDASEGYFGKLPENLNLSECAMLAGIPNAPSVYSPYVDFMLSKKRQFIVIDAMVKNGYLREEVAESAKIKPITLAH